MRLGSQIVEKNVNKRTLKQLLKLAVREAERQKDKKHHARLDLRNRCEDLSEDISRVYEELERVKKTCHHLGDGNDELIRENDALKSSLRVAEEEKAALKQHVAGLETSLRAAMSGQRVSHIQTGEGHLVCGAEPVFNAVSAEVGSVVEKVQDSSATRLLGAVIGTMTVGLNEVVGVPTEVGSEVPPTYAQIDAVKTVGRVYDAIRNAHFGSPGSVGDDLDGPSPEQRAAE